MAARWTSKTRKWALSFAMVLVAFAIMLVVYLNSNGFQTRVRQIATAKLEHVTGGGVEIGKLAWSWRRLEFIAEDVTIHGSEATSQQPYFHADRVFGRLKLLSLFRAELGLHELEIERPVIHVITSAGGRTNIPVPKEGQTNRGRANEIFDLDAEHLAIAGGELIWNELRFPLSVTASDVNSRLSYVPQSATFDGSLTAGKIDSTISGLRPFSSALQMQFTLARDHVTVKSLHASSGGSVLDGKGEVANLADPQVTVQYALALQAQDLAQVLRNSCLKDGALRASGNAALTRNSFDNKGIFSLAKLQWRSRTLDVSNFAAHGSFNNSATQLLIGPIEATWAGGSLHAEITAKNWLGYLTRIQMPAGTAKLRFSNLDLGRALEVLSPRFAQLHRLPLESRVSGTLNGSWRGKIKNGNAEIALALTAPQAATRGYLPVRGELAADYSGRDGSLSIQQGRMNLGPNELVAKGRLARSNSHIDLRVAAQDLNPLQPVLSDFNLPVQPVQLNGSASFLGSLTGDSMRPTIAGHLDALHCDTILQFKIEPPVAPRSKRSHPGNSPAAAVARRLHWDSLSIDLTFAPDHIAIQNGIVLLGSSQARFSVNSAVHNYALSQNSVFNGEIAIVNASIADLQSIAGKNYPVNGTIWLNARAFGTPLLPNVRGDFKISKGRAVGMPFNLAEGAFAVTGAQEELRQMQVQFAGGASLSASGAYDRENRSFKFAFSGKKFDISRLPALQRAHWQASGTADIRGEAEGTTDAPRVNATVALRDLVLNGERVGNLDARARTLGSKMHVTAQSDFARSNLTIIGDVNLEDSWPAEVTLDFNHLDIDPLLTRYVHGRVTEHSAIDGQVTLRGPVLTPHQLEVKGALQSVFVDVENVALRSEGPIEFEFSREAFNLQRLHIVGQQTDFNASGELPLRNGPPATLRANGSLNLEILKSFDPDMVSYGTTTLNVKVGGSLATPQVTGQLQIVNAGMAPMDYPAGLSSINGTMVFNENRLVIQNLTAQTGGGELALGGFIAYSHGIYFALTATGKAIRLRYPPGVSAVVNPDLRFEGSLQHSLISGEVRITKFGLTPQFDFAYYLSRSQLPPAVVSPNSLLNTIHFDVHFITSPALEVETSLAKLSGDADLHLRGTAAQPMVLGRIDIAEGTLSFSGTQYTLDRGSVVFSNPVRILPVLDLQASARVRDYDITISLHGPIDKLSTTYRSDPPLPPADIIALLALGRTQQQTVLNTAPQQTYPSLTTNQLLTTALNYAQSSRVQRLFGASRIKIDPQAGGPENNPNARLTVEEQVSNRATLTYITNLSQSAQEVIQMEFYINRQLSLVAIRDQNGVVSLSIHLRQRKR